MTIRFRICARLCALAVFLICSSNVNLSFATDSEDKKADKISSSNRGRSGSGRSGSGRSGSGRSGSDQTSRFNNDAILRGTLADYGVEAIDKPSQDPQHVELGQLLFFDRILSGNMDTACATCHHPFTTTSDSLSLGVGTGSATLGEIGLFRIRGVRRSFIPRNSPDIFNRGSVHWSSAFWDSRVSVGKNGVVSPAGDALPVELETPLQIQAMFPVTSRDEMCGSLDDASFGNELAAISDGDFQGVWDGLMVRLLSIQEYRDLFKAAFPDVPESSLGFQHAAIAIAAFEAEAFGMNDSPFDQYLLGDSKALTRSAKQGAALFFGKAGCGDCHSGPLLTDQLHHNLAVPQLGPGKDEESGLDFGRFGETGQAVDLYSFRTPPLRNVTETGPWMHNGSFSDLQSVIKHHLDGERSLKKYRARNQLTQVDLQGLVVTNQRIHREMLETLETSEIDLERGEINKLVDFLESLTAPNLSARLEAAIPSSVPSGMLETALGE